MPSRPATTCSIPSVCSSGWLSRWVYSKKEGLTADHLPTVQAAAAAALSSVAVVRIPRTHTICNALQYRIQLKPKSASAKEY